MPSTEKPTALFFGSFNPIHIGHLCVAEYLVEFGGLNEVWFVVSPHNPLKDKATLLADYARFEMVQEAIGNDTRFRANDIEFHLPKPSYTIDTLTHLSEKYPDRKFILTGGTDLLLNFHKWKNYEAILAQYSLLLYPRHGSDEHQLTKHSSVKLIDAPRIEISASFIRNAIHNKKSVKYFLPEKVYQLIDNYGYYL
ncbi:MAG TPA: nicotinate (nicotinamide) nucleotide adenylyltransferase [Lentimicrobium sp.]|nr:nicotinate (nicotinamide) nucleotide adenylyltransferase [Lentimicrobium sp.]